ncbi:hypothetical protein NM688_g3614 [Phlebia brevispora]|uniref:Uncharacterized protein n=1 Tax=Phlebia brevispora TaxID=194682 RepID=A0ACC1T5B1_9APHY|nr:hypothetical protein NM688_g3614 [Phlebia brevispora]
MSLCTLTLAEPPARRAEMTLHEYITSIPSGFEDNGPANPDSVLDLRIALVQSDTDGLLETVRNISTPDHPSYGQHLSAEEVAKFITPTPETVAAVNAWLEAAGLNTTTSSLSRDMLQLNATVSVANELLDANFSLFTNTATGEQSIRTLNYSIPTDLIGHISFVHPTISFATAQPHAAALHARAPNHDGFDPNSCNSNLVTPKCVQEIYGVPATLYRPTAGRAVSSIGVTGMLGEFANREDLVTFLHYYRDDITAPQAKTFTFQGINGGQNNQNIAQAGLEADLDTQYTVGVATGIPMTFYSVGTNVAYTYFVDLLNYLQGQPNLPAVITTSYGGNEHTFSTVEANWVCTAFSALGARGVSVIFSSGDGGVGGSSRDTANQCPNGNFNFVPVFPASCPYVTVVGSTSLRPVPNGVIGHYQEAASYSAGGFSNHFNVAPHFQWQLPFINNYLNSIYPQYLGRFSPLGRGFPDVSALGTNVAVDYRGVATKASGTSASAPMFASMIALINAERFERGKAPLGFLNPFLYANPDAFEDIIGGSNPGCGTPGFEAKQGWDPVTGLGTPRYGTLMRAAVALP